MEKSLFFQWLQTRFVPVITRFVETINGRDGAEPQYLFQRWLTKEFSVDLKWGTLNSNGSSVAADVVALDASVPLKKRDSFGAVEGEVPKIGMKMRKSEREMQELKILEATNQNGNRTNQILQKLFNDPLRVTRGVYERLEYMLLEGISTGYATISEDKNEGIAVRISYGFSPSNSFGVTAKWSTDTATPISDINRITEAASEKGRSVGYMLMDKKAFNNFKSKAEVKELYAAGLNFSGSNIPTPNFQQVNDALAGNNMPQIVIIDRTVNIEKDGTRVAHRPWAEGVVAFVPDLNLGRVVYSTLVEADNPAEDVTYATADDYILVSEFHTKDPFSETISSQALAVPVIDNVNNIYLLNTEEATASLDTQTEGDATFTYKGTDYTKASVVEGLNATDEVPNSTVAQADSTLAGKIDKLSAEGVTTFETYLVPTGV